MLFQEPALGKEKIVQRKKWKISGQQSADWCFSAHVFTDKFLQTGALVHMCLLTSFSMKSPVLKQREFLKK